MEKTILIGADPIGRVLKDAVCEELIKEGYEIEDIGSREGMDVDYYVVGNEVGKRISAGEYERAIIFCGTGMGVNIVANKHPGVYCGLCESVTTARLCRTINNCNVLSMGALTTTVMKASAMVHAFLNTEFAKDFDLAEPAFLSKAYEEIQKIEEGLYHSCSTQ